MSANRPCKTCIALGLALSLAALPTTTALAEDIDTNPDADQLQLQVERTAAAYDEAVAAAESAQAALSDNQQQLEELQEALPKQQAKSDAAARELYKFQQQGLGIIDLLLSADDFFDFLATLDYANRVTATNIAEVNKLKDMKAELEGAQETLTSAKADADAKAAEAERALIAAQEARLEAQMRAQEAARQAAEAAAAAKAAGSGAQAGASSALSQGDQAVASIEDGADWGSDEAAFVDSWSGRIDAYLEGSPLAGQGRTFAQAAWNYGVDPRWSPAIAWTESTLGQYCFLPHNAWGWGSVSWDSWEEAIDAHVRGLARGYGYTISMEAASKYCPGTAQSWYDKTLGQMNLI